MPNHYDIIIIGSGLGGLECGVILTRAGKRVLVLERSNQPGGCMQSYRRGGLMYDTGLHYVGGLEEGQSLHAAFSYLGLIDLPWCRMDRFFDRILINGNEYCFSQGYDAFVDNLSKAFPKERHALQQYASMLRNVDSKTTDIGAYNYLNDLFHDPLLISVLSATSMKMELNKDSLPLFAFAHGINSYIDSSWRLKGDGSLIVDRLVQQIRNGGGDVICRTEVNELIEKDDIITKAICTNGKQYAGDIFIADIHPSSLCCLVKSSNKIKKVYRKRMSSLANTSGMFTVSLQLKPNTLKYFNWNEFIYSNSNVWEYDENNNEVTGVMLSCRVPEDNTEYASQLDILCRMSWKECLPWTDTTVGRRGDEYVSHMNRKADECIKLAEMYIPRLSEMVCKRYISTPLTYRDYLAAPEGTAFGIRNDYRFSMLTFLSPRTPIGNLFLTGQNVMLPGIEGVTKTAFDTCNAITPIANH